MNIKTNNDIPIADSETISKHSLQTRRKTKNIIYGKCFYGANSASPQFIIVVSLQCCSAAFCYSHVRNNRSFDIQGNCCRIFSGKLETHSLFISLENTKINT